MKKYSKNQLQRYPIYLKYLRQLKEQGLTTVSSPLIAKELGYSEEQIRKDPDFASQSAALFGSHPKLYWIAMGRTDFLYQSCVDLRAYWDTKHYPYEYGSSLGRPTNQEFIFAMAGMIRRNYGEYLD